MSVTESSHPYVLIGRPGQGVLIRVLGRLHPDADDYWDGNWLMSAVEVSAGGFRADLGAGLRAEELRSFREGLARIYTDMSGEVTLTSMEEWLLLTVGVVSRGRLSVLGLARDQPGGGNELRFAVDGLDLSYLPAIVAALSGIEAAYPVLGSL